MTGSDQQKGFTLFETLIAFGIFSMVLSSVMAVFTSTLRIQRHSSASQAIIDNVRFGLEFVERELPEVRIEDGVASSDAAQPWERSSGTASRWSWTRPGR